MSKNIFDDNISEADPNDIANILKETEDLDGDLFRTIKSNPSSDKTKASKGKSVLFEDDPVADIEKISGIKQDSFAAPAKPAPKYQTSFSMFDDPTSKNRLPEPKQANNNLRHATSMITTNEKASKAKLSFEFDDEPLFSPTNKSFEIKTSEYRPSTAEKQTSGSSLQAQLSSAATKSEDDFGGGYVPSVSANTRRGLGLGAFADEFFKPASKPAAPASQLSTSPFSSAFKLAASSDQSRRDDLRSSQKVNKSFEDLFESNINSLDDILASTRKGVSNDLNRTAPAGAMAKTQTSKSTEKDIFSPTADLFDSNKQDINQSLRPAQTGNMSLSATGRQRSIGLFEKPPLPATRDILFDIEPISKPPASKESMNSSFADSVDNNEKMNNSIDPLGKDHQAPKENEENWFSSLVANKKVSKSSTDSTILRNELDPTLQKSKQLEYQNSNLKFEMDQFKTNYEMQIQIIKDGYEKQLKILQDSHEDTERRLMKENENLKDVIDSMEKEKQSALALHKRKMDEAKQEFEHEMERMKQLHKISIENLKSEHEDVVRSLKKMKESEVDAAMAASSHKRTIESVLTLIEENTKNLDGLSQRVQMGQMMNMSEAEIQLKARENKIKLQEDRLLKQQKEYENEIKMLNETIHRLENHLAEQTKQVAQERWQSKQAEKKMEALQEALLHEQRMAMDKLTRERTDIERSKDDILNEQKRLMQQVYEEKRKIAEEKAQLEASIKAYKEKTHQDSLNNINSEAQLAVLSRSLQDEKARLEIRNKELMQIEKVLKQERQQIDQKAAEIEAKASKLEQMSFMVSQKNQQAEEILKKSVSEKETQMKVFEQANKIKLNHDSRLDQIQQQLLILNEKEALINQEKVNLYKIRQDIEQLKKTVMCNKCRDPIKETTHFMETFPPAMATSTLNYRELNTFKLNPMVSIRNYDLKNTSQIEDDKLVRQLKLEALKDRQFLTEEKQFIDTLKSNSAFIGIN